MEKGDIVYIDYEAWVVGQSKPLDTTNADIAKKYQIFDEKKSYKPEALIIGVERVFKGLDASLLNAELGKDYEVEIPPSEGAGERDPKLVELHSIREISRLPEFRKEDAKIEIGKEIFLNNKLGTIVAVTAGRVRIDFNKKLAGKTLKYRYKITEKLDKPEDKVKAILEMNYVNAADFKVEVEKDTATIVLPDICKYDLNWFNAKYRVISDLREFVALKKTRFVEEYIKKEEKKEEIKEMIEEKKEEKKEEGEKKVEAIEDYRGKED